MKSLGRLWGAGLILASVLASVKADIELTSVVYFNKEESCQDAVGPPPLVLAEVASSCEDSTTCELTKGVYPYTTCVTTDGSISGEFYSTFVAALFDGAPYVAVEYYQDSSSCDDPEELANVWVYLANGKCNTDGDTSFVATIADTGEVTIVNYSDTECTPGEEDGAAFEYSLDQDTRESTCAEGGDGGYFKAYGSGVTPIDSSESTSNSATSWTSSSFSSSGSTYTSGSISMISYGGSISNAGSTISNSGSISGEGSTSSTTGKFSIGAFFEDSECKLPPAVMTITGDSSADCSGSCMQVGGLYLRNSCAEDYLEHASTAFDGAPYLVERHYSEESCTSEDHATVYKADKACHTRSTTGAPSFTATLNTDGSGVLVEYSDAQCTKDKVETALKKEQLTGHTCIGRHKYYAFNAATTPATTTPAPAATTATPTTTASTGSAKSAATSVTLVSSLLAGPLAFVGGFAAQLL